MEREEQNWAGIFELKNETVNTKAGPSFLNDKATADAFRIHQDMPGYAPTPLVRLDGLAARLRVQAVFVKDESKRFGLNAFKGLGALYALTALICRELKLNLSSVTFSDLQEPELQETIQKMVFVTATDGNHGKGIAWAAGQLGCVAHVYMPAGSSEYRAQAIREVNPRAEVVITDFSYDDAVRYAADQAEKNGWFLVQDTSWEGYEQVPMWILQGYTTMVREACGQLKQFALAPTHVFLQAGVGAMAGSVTGYLANYYAEHRPVIVIVEPETMACLYESARINDEMPHPAANQAPTIMAGLNCGEPCELTWPVLRDFAGWYTKCPDSITEEGMRILAFPEMEDSAIISGESGAVTIGLLNEICTNQSCAGFREQLGLNENSVVLCFSTEGDTDPESYQRILSGGKHPVL